MINNDTICTFLYLGLQERFNDIKEIIRSSYSKDIKLQWPKKNMIGENKSILIVFTD
jgi:hypothetical protein